MKDNIRQNKRMTLFSLCMIGFLLLILNGMLLSSGCLGINTDNIKTQALDTISPIVVLKGSTQYEKMYPSVTTTVPTIVPIAVATIPPVPTSPIKARQIDMYANGERWEKQWFKHVDMVKPNPLSDASPSKPREFGIVVYDHKYLSSYTWWSDANGQYFKEIPKPGYKFLFVWVHEEIFGNAKTNIHSMPSIDESAFMVQVMNQGKSTLHYNDTTYYPVNTILEFDTKADYYGISRTAAFGYIRKFIGMNSKYGGWIAEKQDSLYIGKGNSLDGYIVYQVPSYATDSDTFLVGNFGTQGNAYWRFDIYAGN
jgi:hypothetical protein